MNKNEIDEMMRDLPSQKNWCVENTTEKLIAGFAFVIFIIMICLL